MQIGWEWPKGLFRHHVKAYILKGQKLVFFTLCIILSSIKSYAMTPSFRAVKQAMPKNSTVLKSITGPSISVVRARSRVVGNSNAPADPLFRYYRQINSQSSGITKSVAGLSTIAAGLATASYSKYSKNTDFEAGADRRYTSLAVIARAMGFKYIKHETPCYHLEEITQSGKLFSGQTVKRGHGMSKIYLQLVTDQNPVRLGTYNCTFFFSLNLLDERQDYHITNGWFFGELYNSESDSGLISATPNDPARVIQVLKRAIENPTKEANTNEIVFIHPVDFKHLVKITLGNNANVDRSMRQEWTQTTIHRLKAAGMLADTSGPDGMPSINLNNL